MKKFSMQCSCGHTIDVEASDLKVAIGKIKNIMNKDAIDKHMAEKHSGEDTPSQNQVYAMIEKTTREVIAAQ